jgi:hypothetical protein
LDHERGAALVVALLFSTILAGAGILAATATSTSINNSQVYKSKEQAFSYAEAGIAEVKGRLFGSTGSNPNFIGDPAANPNPLWSAYILTSTNWAFSQDPDYNSSYTNYVPTAGNQTATALVVNSLQPSFPFWAKVRHRREYDEELGGHTPATPHYIDNDGSTATHTAANPGSIIYYGYPGGATAPVRFTTATPTTSPPVELIRAYAQRLTSTRRVEIDAVHNVGPPIVAAIYTRDNFSANGNDTVNGNDYCSASPGYPPVYTMGTVSTTGPVTFTGNPANPVQNGTLNINLGPYINGMQSAASIVLTSGQSNQTYGSPTNFVTVYANPGPLGITLNTVTGYGVLLVNGNLTMGGNFSWNGLILVTGSVTFNGGGNAININGALLSDSSTNLSGHIKVDYNSCNVSKSLASQGLQIKRWKLL